MSKGFSRLYFRTIGEKNALIEEVKALGYKINPDDVICITRDPSGKIVWLEKGHINGKPSGLAHILSVHKLDFNTKGIPTFDIANFIITAISEGNIIGYQGKGTSRPIYKVEYHGKTLLVAITVGDNGYIVGANPK